MANSGKVFEMDFRQSIPDEYLLIRLPDPPQAFTKRSDTKFAHKNPCDFILFDTKKQILYCLELKTTKYKSMSFEDINGNDTKERMVHKHQILGLLKFANYDNVQAAFIFNFRDEKNSTQRTYYQNINDFQKMCADISKVSFDEIDLIRYNAIKINGEKKRVHFKWDMGNFFENHLTNEIKERVD